MEEATNAVNDLASIFLNKSTDIVMQRHRLTLDWEPALFATLFQKPFTFTLPFEPVNHMKFPYSEWLMVYFIGMHLPLYLNGSFLNKAG